MSLPIFAHSTVKEISVHSKKLRTFYTQKNGTLFMTAKRASDPLFRSAVLCVFNRDTTYPLICTVRKQLHRRPHEQ